LVSSEMKGVKNIKNILVCTLLINGKKFKT
jgi:hypothetical protein